MRLSTFFSIAVVYGLALGSVQLRSDIPKDLNSLSSRSSYSFGGE
jgi:hypothetical protein